MTGGDHPCFDRDAHRYYARIHLPVAPGCNIQCGYCHREFDCVNESRPGVTSRLLTPEQAADRVHRAANRMPNLRVAGVAGPGEPLAHARRTFRTFELVRERCPELSLCLSTNGLTLLDHVDRIVGLGVGHVTVTVNMTDPAIGAKIYSWVGYRGRRYTGAPAARILSERQLAGLRALADRGVQCKVNSVLIPGVNDEHLADVARTVKDLGAVTHNVLPLVCPDRLRGALGGQRWRAPTPGELEAARHRCEQASGAGLNIMRHCRQCRADALGLLGQDLDARLADSTPVGAGRPAAGW